MSSRSTPSKSGSSSPSSSATALHGSSRRSLEPTPTKSSSRQLRIGRCACVCVLQCACVIRVISPRAVYVRACLRVYMCVCVPACVCVCVCVCVCACAMQYKCPRACVPRSPEVRHETHDIHVYTCRVKIIAAPPRLPLMHLLLPHYCIYPPPLPRHIPWG